jgi:hypothetical protein
MKKVYRFRFTILMYAYYHTCQGVCESAGHPIVGNRLSDLAGSRPDPERLRPHLSLAHRSVREWAEESSRPTPSPRLVYDRPAFRPLRQPTITACPPVVSPEVRLCRPAPAHPGANCSS